MSAVWSKLHQYLPFSAGLFLGLYFSGLYFTGLDFAYFPGDLGDARFNLYILEHAWRYITGDVPSLWNAPFMYPEKNVITFSDNLLGNAPFYGIFRLFGLDRVTSFQGWVILVMILNYSCCYLFLNYLVKNRSAAAIGAFIFAFSIALHPQALHAQTFPRFPIPLALWTGILFYEKLKPGFFFLSLLFLVYQFYCGIYLGFLLAVPLGLLYLIVIGTSFKGIINRAKSLLWSGKILTSIIINLAILLPLMLPYETRSEKTGYSSFEEILPKIPTLKSYLHSPEGSYLWGWLSNTGNSLPMHWNHELFPGGVAILSFIILLIYGMAKLKLLNHTPGQKLKSLVILSLAGLLTFLFFLRIGDFSLYNLLYKLPGYGSMDAVYRIINVLLIFMAIGTAFLADLIRNQKPRYYFIFASCLLALAIADNYYKPADTYPYRTPKQAFKNRVNKVKSKMKAIPKREVVSYEPGKQALKQDPSIVLQLDAMLAAQSLDLKSINGYSGSCPGEFSSYWQNLDKKSREKWLASEETKPDTIYVVQ